MAWTLCAIPQLRLEADFWKYSARRLIWREAVGLLIVVGCGGGRGLKPHSVGPMSASQLCCLLVSCKDLQQEIHRQRKDKKESCIKNECGDRNMHLGTWLSVVGFPCKLWVRNYWDLQV